MKVCYGFRFNKDASMNSESPCMDWGCHRFSPDQVIIETDRPLELTGERKGEYTKLILRRHGVEAPLLVMGYPSKDVDLDALEVLYETPR